MAIEIRGVIVGADYDMDYMFRYIHRGLITPESYFRRELAKAPTGEPLDVYINSPGGSVFAGYEMINALRSWQEGTGQSVNVTLGGMAASMAAYMAAYFGPVRAHANTKIMYHGASAGVWGGSSAMRDEAKLLDDINAELQTMLVTRYALDSDRVAEWFAEGRQGWLTAREAQTAGLVYEIIDAQAAMPERAAAGVEDRSGRIAACWEILDDERSNGPDGSTDDDHKHNTNDGGRTVSLKAILSRFGPTADETEDAAEQGLELLERFTASLSPEDAAKHAEVLASLRSELSEDEAEQDEAAEDAADGDDDEGSASAEALAEITAERDGLTAQLTEITAERETLTTQVAELTAQVETLTTQHADADRRAQSAEDRLAQLLPDSATPPPLDHAGMTFAQALKQCDGNYEQAREKFPEAYEASRDRYRK